jgi:hypothetical protein
MNMQMDKKWRDALMYGALFFVLSQPMVRDMLRNMVQTLTSAVGLSSVSQSVEGSAEGLFGEQLDNVVHALVFAVVVRYCCELL